MEKQDAAILTFFKCLLSRAIDFHISPVAIIELQTTFECAHCPNRVLSKAFGRLKLTLPWVPPDTKLSKLDTLRYVRKHWRLDYCNGMRLEG